MSTLLVLSFFVKKQKKTKKRHKQKKKNQNFIIFASLFVATQDVQSHLAWIIYRPYQPVLLLKKFCVVKRYTHNVLLINKIQFHAVKKKKNSVLSNNIPLIYTGDNPNLIP